MTLAQLDIDKQHTWRLMTQARKRFLRIASVENFNDAYRHSRRYVAIQAWIKRLEARR